MDLVETVRKQTGLSVIVIGERKGYDNIDSYSFVGTIETATFLSLFANAEIVVTNSFHGMVFSVLMEKKFLVFGHSDRNARIENFMEKVDLKSRLVEKGRMCTKEEMMQDIDWMHVRKLVEKEREHSTEFIKSMLVSS